MRATSLQRIQLPKAASSELYIEDAGRLSIPKRTSDKIIEGLKKKYNNSFNLLNIADEQGNCIINFEITDSTTYQIDKSTDHDS